MNVLHRAFIGTRIADDEQETKMTLEFDQQLQDQN